MIKWEAFSASAGDFTLEHSLTSSQVGGGYAASSSEGDSSGRVDGPAIDSRRAMAESRVGRLVTSCQDGSQDASICPMKLRSWDMRGWIANVLRQRERTSRAARWTWIIDHWIDRDRLVVCAVYARSKQT